MYDDILAKAIVQKALNGDAGAQTLLGQALDLHGEYQEAVKWLRSAADQGYDAAQTTLGSEYFWGHGVEKDYKKAVYWWRKAADQGQGEAQALLGAAYYKGYGVSPDENEAVVWLEKAAQQGIERAISLLANIKQHGGTEQKNSGSGGTAWLIAAAVIFGIFIFLHAGSKPSPQKYNQPQYQMSQSTSGSASSEQRTWTEGKSDPGNNAGPMHQVTQSGNSQKNYTASSGNSEYEQGQKYYYGRGVTKDYYEAAKCYRMAAEQGNAAGQGKLGWM